MNVCVISEKDPVFILYSFVGNHISEFYVYDVIHGKDEDKFKRVVSSWACVGDDYENKYYTPSHVSIEINSLDDYINDSTGCKKVVAVDGKSRLYICEISNDLIEGILNV